MLVRMAMLILLSTFFSVANAEEEAETEATEEASDRPPRAKKKKKTKKKNSYDAFSESMIGFLGVGEVWQDAAIARVHRSSRFAGTGFFAAGITQVFGVEVELGYSRMTNPAVDKESGQQTAEDTSFEMMPVALDLTMRIDTGRSEVFFGMGPAIVAFNDRSPSNAISGTKLGVDFRLGTRIRTWFVQDTIRPGARGVKRMDFELLLGRRQHHLMGVGEGLNLSAWRVGAGVVARL
jgi:hypothetical protein